MSGWTSHKGGKQRRRKKEKEKKEKIKEDVFQKRKEDKKIQ